MTTCPYCGSPAMTLWQKLTTRPRHGRPCTSCGKQVNPAVGWTALAVVVPMTLGATAANQSGSLVIGAVAILAGTAGALLLYLYAVPIAPYRG